jgi:hypothetical protein
MRKKLFYLPLLFIAVSLFTLSSCLDINRKIKVNPDGSGNEVQTFKIDKMFYDLIFGLVSGLDSSKAKNVKDSLYNHDDMLKTIRENLSKKEGIEIVSLTGVTNSDSSSTYTFDYNFNYIDKIGYATNISPKELSGEEKSKSQIVWKDNGNSIYFSLLYTPDSGKEPTESDNNRAFSYLFAGKNVSFEIEFPYEIESSNALNVSGKKCIWTFPISDMMLEKDKKLFLEATLKK